MVLGFPQCFPQGSDLGNVGGCVVCVVCVSGRQVCAQAWGKQSGAHARSGHTHVTGPGAPTLACASDETPKGTEASPSHLLSVGLAEGLFPLPDARHLLQSSPLGCGCAAGAWRSCPAAGWAMSSEKGTPTTSQRATLSPTSGRSQHQEHWARSQHTRGETQLCHLFV